MIGPIAEHCVSYEYDRWAVRHRVTQRARPVMGQTGSAVMGCAHIIGGTAVMVCARFMGSTTIIECAGVVGVTIVLYHN